MKVKEKPPETQIFYGIRSLQPNKCQEEKDCYSLQYYKIGAINVTYFRANVYQLYVKI